MTIFDAVCNTSDNSTKTCVIIFIGGHGVHAKADICWIAIAVRNDDLSKPASEVKDLYIGTCLVFKMVYINIFSCVSCTEIRFCNFHENPFPNITVCR